MLLLYAIVGRRKRSMSETQCEKSKARTRSLRWMETLWEGASTTAEEVNRKEEVLWVFRELARDSKHEKEVRDYEPWEPRWR
jgi:hypothetical protein